MCQSNSPETGGSLARRQSSRTLQSDPVLVELGLKAKGKVMQNLLLGVGIGLVGILVVLTSTLRCCVAGGLKAKGK
jgi:hypothetical protein